MCFDRESGSMPFFVSTNTLMKKIFDASLWKIGGSLKVSGSPKEYFNEAVSADDVETTEHDWSCSKSGNFSLPS